MAERRSLRVNLISILALVLLPETEGRWRPAPGYDWASPDGVSDMSVGWKPGTPHPRYENIVADEVKGKWVPAPGYDWAEPDNPDDYSVVSESPSPSPRPTRIRRR